MAGYREFQTGEVLTASNVNSFLMNQSVMVFADSTARDTALGTAIATGNALVEGMLTYNKDTGALEVYDGSAWSGVGGSSVKKIAAFTANGTWTVPAGVTYAIAHMVGGGGGAGVTTSGGNGSDSSVAFASGTVTATGGTKALLSSGTGGAYVAAAGNANSGQGAQMVAYEGIYRGTSNQGGAGAYIVAGADVTPAASITVTVGAGGTAGTGGAAGGSGYVYIEYYE